MNWLRLDEAAEFTGRPEPTLRRWLNSGTIPGRKVPLGKREVWEISQETAEQIKEQGGTKGDDYEKLHTEWKAAMKSGALGRTNLNQNSIDTMVFAMANYWGYLRKEPSIAFIDAAHLKQAICSVEIDYEKKNCHYGKKYNMFSAVRSFIRLLILKGYRTQSDLEATKGLLPKRTFPAKKTVLEHDSYTKLLAENDAWKERRGDYDVLLTRTIVMLSAMAGLRNAEIRNLQLSHVDIPNRIIYVVLGKGNKNRRIGITSALLQQLEAYLEKRPESQYPNFLISRIGKPITAAALNKRISNLAQQAKVNITPHGLRRTFATLNIKQGMPLPVAQKLLGHTDIKTTMEYVMIDEMQAVDYLRGQ